MDYWISLIHVGAPTLSFIIKVNELHDFKLQLKDYNLGTHIQQISIKFN